MLKSLNIRNFAIIEDLEVEFNSGFIAITGETGAGKSIIVDAISMLLGARSAFDKIRNGETKAYIEGVFIIDDESFKNELSQLIDLEIEDDTIIISRSLDLNGKSVAKINYKTIPLSLLKDIAGNLIDIHSQQKNVNYLNENNQLSLLNLFLVDECEEYDFVFKTYSQKYKYLIQKKNEYENIISKFSLNSDIDYLEYQIKEIENANLYEGEIEELEEEKQSLNSFKKTADKIIEFINISDSIKGPMYNAKRTLNNVDNDEFLKFDEKFNDIYYQFDDLCDEIRNKFDNYQDSLSRLDFITERLYSLHSLRKKYGSATEDILSKYNEMLLQRDLILNGNKIKEDLENEISLLKEDCFDIAKKLHKLRLEGAIKLSSLVDLELNELFLNNANFKVEINLTDELNEYGCDKATFLLRANIGESFLPLDKTASLGESSRLNLALKTIFNRYNSSNTIIFDEIDIGISGRVASAVANKMKTISLNNQVISISHLAQVCAKADHHYHIYKEVVNNRTYSRIKLLNTDERQLEIAKMISADEVNSSSIEAAKNLLK